MSRKTEIIIEVAAITGLLAAMVLAIASIAYSTLQIVTDGPQEGTFMSLDMEGAENEDRLLRAVLMAPKANGGNW